MDYNEAFRRATFVDWRVGLVVYRSAQGDTIAGRAETAKAYNSLVRMFEAGTTPAALKVLVWWGDDSHRLTLRVRPAAFAHMSTHLRFKKRLEQLFFSWPTRLLGEKSGWRVTIPESRRSCSDFRDELVKFLLLERGESTPESQTETKRVAKGDAQASKAKRKDDILMKKIFPVAVCVRRAKKEGGAKEDGKLLDAYAPKFVPANDADAARTKVVAELIKAEKYGDIDDPDVRIQVFSPFTA